MREAVRPKEGRAAGAKAAAEEARRAAMASLYILNCISTKEVKNTNPIIGNDNEWMRFLHGTIPKQNDQDRGIGSKALPASDPFFEATKIALPHKGPIGECNLMDGGAQALARDRDNMSGLR